MNQKVSWTLLGVGVVALLYQLADMLQHHSTWASVFEPAGVGEILTSCAAGLVAILGALGVTIKSKAARSDEARAAAVRDKVGVAILALACGLAGAGCALVATQPTAAQTQALHDDAVKIANATTTALLLTTQALTTADDLEKQHVIPTSVLLALADDSKRFATIAHAGLNTLEQLAQPAANLRLTVSTILTGLQPFIDRLHQSANPLLNGVATSIDIAIDVLRAFILKGGPHVGDPGGD